MRILVVAPSLDILGGQAVQAARLLSRLHELAQFEVGFLPINPRLPGVFRKLQAVKYVRTVVTSLLYIATLLMRVPRYDVVHVFSASYLSFVIAPTPAILIAKLFRRKVLLNYHSGEAEDHLTRWRSSVSTIRLVDEVVVPSTYLAKIFAKFGIKAQAIHNLIELDHFTFQKREHLRPVFLSNRNLETHYGVDCVLRAFGVIQRSFPRAELIVAGDGSQRESLEILCRNLDLKNVSFVGRVEHDNIVAQYQLADIYLNGSEIDNQPLSILEAFACGLPVVTTDAGGIPDMVKDQVNGFVVARGDHKAMARRARQLLNEGHLTELLSENARAECAKYSWAQVREQWTSVYQAMAFGSQTTAAIGKKPSRLHKLRKMDFSEGSARFEQKRSAFFERMGLSTLSRLPSDRALLNLLHCKLTDGFLNHFRTRKAPAFFGSFDRPQETVTQLRARWPEAAPQIIADANRILVGQFDLLGYKNLHFGNPINWHLDPLSWKLAPQIHWSQIDYLNPNIAGDHKVVWELNRHQYFTKLGQAYWISGDEKYAETFVAHLNAWMDQNPPKQGINWASSLEVAFRSISWLWAFHYFKKSRALDAKTFTRAIKFLYLNGHHLETYLSTYFSPNTHLTGEALGMFYLGTMLPEFKAATRWRELGRNILVEQLERQVQPDGVYFEQSSYYHRYTTEFYTHLVILSRLNKGRLNSAVDQKLSALLDHLMYITHPDGTTPLFGDDDGGRLVMLDRRAANDFRGTLSTAAALFGRGDYKFVAGEVAEESLWLLGPDGVRSFDELKSHAPSQQSIGFPNGGYYVMRDGWHSKANYLLFDCGPHGADNGGHAHADALAIEVAAKGRPTLVDPGTSTYTESIEARNSFRESAAHNTLLVDGESSSIPGGAFSWTSVAKSELVSWLSKPRFDYVEGRHDGYQRLPEPATHSRSILFLKDSYWVMRDRVASNGNHKAELRFHLAPGLALQEVDATTVDVSATKAGLQLAAFGPQGQWSREQGQFSNCYGMKKTAEVAAFSANSLGKSGDSEFITFMFPNSGRHLAQFQVKEVESIGGRAFEIISSGYRDLMLFRDSASARVETVRVATDFDWGWARFSNQGSEAEAELLELLVMNGQHVELDGKEILNSAKAIQHLLASRTGDRFRVETDEGLVELQFPICSPEQSGAETVNKVAKI